MTLSLKLLYTCKWDLYFSTEKMDWYTCGAPFYEEGKKLLRLCKNMKFYEETTGKTFITSKEKLVILEIVNEKPKKVILDGYVIEEECGKCIPLICSKATFHIKKKSLEEYNSFIKNTTKKCDIIEFCTKNNSDIKVEGFPTPKEINKMLETSTQEEVCKKLINKNKY